MLPSLSGLIDRRFKPSDRKVGSAAATAEDVKALYATLLGRQPESERAISDHLSGAPTVMDVLDRIYNSAEADSKRAHAVMAKINAQRVSNHIESDATSPDAALLLDHIHEVWSRYGRTEAYYSVLTVPDYLMEKMDTTRLEDFYASGDENVDNLQRVFSRNGMSIDFTSSVFELGCGVGRIGAALAKRFSSYIGVDISAEHLSIAERRFLDVGISNARLVHLNDFLVEHNAYDLFYSVIVLQHNPPPVIKYLLDASLGSLKSGGFIYFQIPVFVYNYTFSVKEYINGVGKKDEMELHAFPERELFSLFRKHDIEVIEVLPDQDIGPMGLSYTIFGRKRPASEF